MLDRMGVVDRSPDTAGNSAGAETGSEKRSTINEIRGPQGRVTLREGKNHCLAVWWWSQTDPIPLRSPDRVPSPPNLPHTTTCVLRL